VFAKVIIIIIGIQPLGRSGQRPELSQAIGMALVRCILGQILRGGLPLLSPAFRHSHFRHQVPPCLPRRERSQQWKMELWARILSGILPK
jgi:hypothetical protein